MVGIEISTQYIVFSDKLDVVTGGELYCGNKWFLNCRVDSIVYGEVVGVVWKCCAISLNNNSAVMFCQNRSRRLHVLRKGGGKGMGCFGSLLGPGDGGKR